MDDTGPGKTDVGTLADLLSVIVVSGAGVVADGAGVKVVGGALVHFVHTVAVEVMTVSVVVKDVRTTVLEPEVLVSVTGHKVVVV